MFKVYSKPSFPSLSVVLSQEPLGGSGPDVTDQRRNAKVVWKMHVRGKHMKMENRNACVCVHLACSSRMQSLDKIHLEKPTLYTHRGQGQEDENLNKSLF